MIMNKLATGITIVAIATTAISVPAKADNKDLTTLLAILAGGLVIHEVIDNKKDRKKTEATVKREKYKKRDKRVTHQHRNGEWYTHESMEELRYYHSKEGRRDRRLKRERDRRRDWDRDESRRDRDHFGFPIQDRITELPIPNKCNHTLRGRFGQSTQGVSRKCLRKHGYKINKNGRVMHRGYRGLSARPTLF